MKVLYLVNLKCFLTVTSNVEKKVFQVNVFVEFFSWSVCARVCVGCGGGGGQGSSFYQKLPTETFGLIHFDPKSYKKKLSPSYTLIPKVTKKKLSL